jgi:type I restriction-modification system DNA methylase subunit
MENSLSAPSLETLRTAAAKFSLLYATTSEEKQDAQRFMFDFIGLFGINKTRLHTEYRVKDTKQRTKFIDGFLKGVGSKEGLLIEMKSRGKDLNDAYAQAMNYVRQLPESDLPRYVLICDFKTFHLYDLKRDENEASVAPIHLNLEDLSAHIDTTFGFLAGYEAIVIQVQEQANIDAAELMGKLHDEFKRVGVKGKDLECYLVRLLFCLFADDSLLFIKQSFLRYVKNHTKIDGSDLHEKLDALFVHLNSDDSKRETKRVPAEICDFPYINGDVFAERLDTYHFTENSRRTLIEACEMDWSKISPSIFGAMFQSIMHHAVDDTLVKSKKRREFGAHYTSEENIERTINPLFMNALKEEFTKIKQSKQANIRTADLQNFQKKLASLNFFDPACGCGNFLVVTYQALRELELEVLEALYPPTESASFATKSIDIEHLVLCDVNQLHGIEIDGGAAQIAIMALWLTDHQMNRKVSDRFGQQFNRIPLNKKGNIITANALTTDWSTIIAPELCHYIIGNPPFIGYDYQNTQQKAEFCSLVKSLNFKPLKTQSTLDYVAAWYFKAAVFMKLNPKIATALVSTSSICQGTQVPLLWPYLIQAGIKINFAHRPFKWTNEASGVAAVTVVIVGFALYDAPKKWLFTHTENKEDKSISTESLLATQINPYLVDAANLLLETRSSPLCKVPSMMLGNVPRDDGHFFLLDDEKAALIKAEPSAEKWIRPFLGAAEFINKKSRWCLWLKDISPSDLQELPLVLERTKKVKAFRLKSTREATVKLADFAKRFGECRQPTSNYLLIPCHSSERREYIPIGYITSDVIIGNSCISLENASLVHFGVLTSKMHQAWMRATCGRLKTDYRYSNTLVYNNFPWPEGVGDYHNLASNTAGTNAKPDKDRKKVLEQQKKLFEDIKTCAQKVLDARKSNAKDSLALLYDPDLMPEDLRKAHNALDKAVDAAYGYKSKAINEAERVAFLLTRYAELTSMPEKVIEKTKKIVKKKM